MNCSTLTSIELYAFNQKPSFCDKPLAGGCRYVLLRLSCPEAVACAGCEVPTGGREIDLVHWGAFLKKIRGISLREAADIAKRAELGWSFSQHILVRSALAELLQPRARVHALVSAAGGSGSRAFQQNTPLFPSNPDTGCLIAESVSYYSIL